MQIFKEYPIKIAFKKLLAKFLSKMSFLIPNRYFLINYYGGKIYLNLRESQMMIERALGVYEYWKTHLVMDLVKPGMVVVDVGVNKGYFSLLFAKLMEDKGKVLSFEPDPDNCFWIKKSINANKYNSIKLYQIALSDKNGEATFYPGKKSGLGSLFLSNSAAPDKKPFKVKTRKLDDILKEGGIEDIDIIKIDVEGSDLLVLKGAENTLKKSKNVKLIMDIDVGSKNERQQVFKFLISCGFKIYSIGKELKRIEKIDELKSKDIYATKY